MSKGYVRYVGDDYVDVTRGKVYSVFFAEEDHSFFDMVDDAGDSFGRHKGDQFIEVSEVEYRAQQTDEKPTSEFSGVVWEGIHFEATCPEEYLEISEAISKLEVFRVEAP